MIVATGAKDDEGHDGGEADDGRDDGGAEVDGEEAERGADLEGHEPDVVDLEHHVGELLRVDGHVVHDHADAMGLAGGAGEAEALAVEGGDEGGAD